MTEFTLNEYQEKALKTAVFNREHAMSYLVLGLVGESAEIGNKWKKHLRGDEKPPSYEEMADELGDVLWYVAGLANELGVDLQEIAQNNIDKLADRAKRGKLKSSGDKR